MRLLSEITQLLLTFHTHIASLRVFPSLSMPFWRQGTEISKWVREQQKVE